MERVLEPFVPGDGAQHAQTRGTGKLGSGLFAKEAGDGGCSFDIGTLGRAPAHDASEHDPGDGRMNARLGRRNPDGDREQDQGRPAEHAQPKQR